MLSPVEDCIKSNEDEFKSKIEEVIEKESELKTITHGIKMENIIFECESSCYSLLNFKCCMTNN